MDVQVNFVEVLVLAGKLVGLVVLVQTLRGIWWLMNLLFVQPPSDPLRHLAGPNGSKMQNHFREVMDPSHSPDTHEQWTAAYGKTFRFHGFGSFDYRLLSFDYRVISHVLNSSAFEKPWQTRRILSNLLGRGVIAMEGEEHKFIRKIIAPAFTSQAIRSLSPIMFQKAEEVKDRWDTILACSETSLLDEKLTVRKSEGATIDVLHWLSRATFDIIGLAGFDYPFNAVQDETDDVYTAYRTMLDSQNRGPDLKRILELFFPILETLLPDQHIRKMKQSQKVIRNAGHQLVANKRAVIMAEVLNSKDITSKDLLSLLIKANLSEDPSKRLSDSELLDQLSTFLFAGSDATAISASWVLHYMSLHPEYQNQLRSELLSANLQGQADTLAVVDSLPFLDAVVRETLRIVPPVHATIRVATRDEIIPLSEPIVLRTNELVREVRIRKGSYVHIPIEGLNYARDLWGNDARVFNPSRWLSVPPNVQRNSGLANLMTFSFGPHACVGWKFTILEIKILLVTLLTQYSFAPSAEISKYSAMITRPYVRGKFDQGPALPLKVSRLV